MHTSSHIAALPAQAEEIIHRRLGLNLIVLETI